MKTILILHTGGTFGMTPMKPSTTLAPGDIQNQILKHVPELKEMAKIETVIPFNIDSSNITLNDWKILAEILLQNKDNYDGFVVIHGTDTIAYTASALSFMLLNFSKPIILTGAQSPLAQIRNDARNNLINAVEIASSGIREIGIFFGVNLYRGNRCSKISTSSYNAFSSPNFPPLAEVGMDLNFYPSLFRGRKKFKPFFEFFPSVMTLKIIPGLSHSYLKSILESRVKGIIIEGYGAGNVPIGEESILPFIEEAVKRKKVVAINTQCHHGRVYLERYQCGKKALNLGVVSCRDMTIEASVTKLMFLLGKYKSPRKVNHYFSRDIAGELTTKSE
ncbi:MAG: asparaginase [Calditrichia bacterium]|nr:asparaginase [Calditrichia bacterium]